jgi:signal transduction histidine kinase
MSIQRRILMGYAVVVCLLLAPAVYALVSLHTVAEQAEWSLSSGLDRLRALEKLKAEFDLAVKVEGIAGVLENPADLEEVRGKAETSLSSLRRLYAGVRPQFLYPDPDIQPRMDVLLGFGEGLTQATGGRVPGPPWNETEMAEIRAEISRVHESARERMLAETMARTHDAWRAFRISLAAALVALFLVGLSTVFALRAMRRPIRQLISATMAVSAGKFGIAVPVTGDDDVSRLTDSFNKMSQSLAVFEQMSADFLSIAAHELRSPLTCIKGYVGVLRATLPDDQLANPEIARYLERIDHEADLMTAKVSELLTFGMIEAGQLQLDTREIMTEGFLLMVGEAFRPIAMERNIDFRMDIGKVPSFFRGDPDRLNQVILNLLDNAFKFTPAGGEVVLRGREAEGQLEIEVADTGQGIPAGQLEVIFEKYARVKSGGPRTAKGTGLGLAVARGIVVAHGGTIGVTSQEGKGSRFIVRLPVKEIEPAERPQKEANQEVA